MIARVFVKRLAHAADLPLPAAQTAGAAGLDLVADCFDLGDGARATRVELGPGQRVLAKTGLCVAIPDGHVGLVCPRSGLALRHGVTVLNGPGIIDSDFRGELGVLLVNLGQDVFVAERGARIAQLVVTPLSGARIELVSELPPTARASGGFGSTGR